LTSASRVNVFCDLRGDLSSKSTQKLSLFLRLGMFTYYETPHKSDNRDDDGQQGADGSLLSQQTDADVRDHHQGGHLQHEAHDHGQQALNDLLDSTTCKKYIILIFIFS